MTDKFMFMEVGAPRRISVDNGTTFVSPESAIAKVGFEEIETWMDPDIKEQVHIELAPCSDIEFLVRYLELADYDLIIG